MTTLIQQRTPSDCVLACIAMAAGAESWDAVWKKEDADAVVASRGVSCFDYDKWGERVGLAFDYLSVYDGHDQKVLRFLLRGQQAILSVNSLNNDGGSHGIYWDGRRIWDPNDGVPGKLAFRFLSSVYITGLHRPKPARSASVSSSVST